MTELDQILPQEAFDLIDEFGKLTTYKFVETTDYDVESGTSDVALDGEPFQPKCAPPESFKDGDTVDGNLVERGDKKLTFPALAFTIKPTPSDLVGFDGKTYTVIAVETVYSGELAALYILQARG